MIIDKTNKSSRWLILGACAAAAASGGCSTASQHALIVSSFTGQGTCTNHETEEIELVDDQWDRPGGICSINTNDSIVDYDNEEEEEEDYVPPV